MVSLQQALLALKVSELGSNEFYFVLHSKGKGVRVYADYKFHPSRTGLMQCAMFIGALKTELEKAEEHLTKELKRLKEEGNW